MEPHQKNIDALKINPVLFPQLGEIWMCALGKNIGREQNGGGESFSRPMLVIKKFNNEIFGHCLCQPNRRK